MKNIKYKNKIENFNSRFNDTAADSRAFSIVLESGILTDMICSYLNRSHESTETFKNRITDFAIDCMNQIYRPYGRTVRDECIIHEYFDLLLDSLVKAA